MRVFQIFIASFIVLVLLSSCAATYKKIDPSTLDYPTLADEANFSYKFDVLKQAGNKKLAKKEDKYRIRVAAVKITNTTSQALKYGLNYKIYSGNSEVILLDPAAVTASVKQTVPTYLLYLLLTPTKLTVTTEKDKSVTPVGYVLGPGLAALNVGIAASANSNFKKELLEYNIMDKEIKTGETIYGLIAVPDNGFAPLTLKTIK